MIAQRVAFEAGEHELVLRLEAELDAVHWRTGQVMLHGEATHEFRVRVVRAFQERHPMAPLNA